MKQCRYNAERQVQACTGITYLSTGNQRRTIKLSRCRCCPTSALGDILIDLTVLIGTRPKTLNRGINHPWVYLLNPLPRETHPIQCTGGKVLHHHITVLNQLYENFLPLVRLGVEGDAAFIAIQHREVEAIDIRNILQLPTRRITNTRAFNFQNIGTKPSQQLCTGRTRLDMRHVQNFYAFQCF